MCCARCDWGLPSFGWKARDVGVRTTHHDTDQSVTRTCKRVSSDGTGGRRDPRYVLILRPSLHETVRRGLGRQRGARAMRGQGESPAFQHAVPRHNRVRALLMARAARNGRRTRRPNAPLGVPATITPTGRPARRRCRCFSSGTMTWSRRSGRAVLTNLSATPLRVGHGERRRKRRAHGTRRWGP